MALYCYQDNDVDFGAATKLIFNAKGVLIRLFVASNEKGSAVKYVI